MSFLLFSGPSSIFPHLLAVKSNEYASVLCTMMVLAEKKEAITKLTISVFYILTVSILVPVNYYFGC